MTKTYKILVWLQLVLLLGLGFKVSTSGKFGDSLVSTIATHYINGIYVGTSDQFSISGTGATTQTGNETVTGNSAVSGSQSAASFLTATVGSSSSTPAALGSAAAGFFTATTTTQFASTTAVTANSQIFFDASPSSTAFTTLNVSCNTTAPSTTQVTKIIPGNGFQVQTLPAASGGTTPYCLTYHIVN